MMPIDDTFFDILYQIQRISNGHHHVLSSALEIPCLERAKRTLRYRRRLETDTTTTMSNGK